METILVSGANGYIASNLIPKLLTLKYKVLALSRNKMNPYEGAIHIDADLLDKNSAQEVIAEADTIIHLGGNTSIYDAESNYTFSNKGSLMQVHRLIDAIQAQKRYIKFIFASSASLYGISPSLPAKESDCINPITIYDSHKMYCERDLLLASKNGLMGASIFRFANVYGFSKTMPLSKDRGIINQICGQALKGKGITVFGDGNFLRDYIHIDDVSDGLILSIQKEKIENGIFNLCTGRGLTIYEAFKYILKVVEEDFNISNNIQMIPFPEQIHDIEKRNFVGDSSKLKQYLDWEPQISFEEGIKNLLHNLSNEA